MQLRDASKTPSVLGLDAKAFAIIFPSLFYMRVSTFFFDLAVLGIFVFLRVKGLELSYAYRRSVSRIRGGIVNARPWWFAKKWRNK